MIQLNEDSFDGFGNMVFDGNGNMVFDGNKSSMLFDKQNEIFSKKV
jgi:hypothetical protein